jgi:tripartite-type tricarboxylate transporter receptor subunit TctC
MNLAMLRGEVDGRGTFSWTSLKPHLKEWIDTGELTILYQQGLRKHADIPKIPLVMELTDDAEIKKALTVQFTAFELGRPYFLAQGVPADRVAALRRAFDMAMKDKDLLADAAKLKQEVNPYSGEEMQKVLADVYATPKPLIARLAEASRSKPDLKVLEGFKKKKKQ